MSDRLELPADPASAAAARRFVRDALATWRLGDLEDPCTLLVSELVTNAVLHARTPVEVTLAAVGGDAVRVEVSDADHRVPTAKRYSLDATTGRGLVLVERLARRWGVEPTAEGKFVWFELDRDSVVAAERAAAEALAAELGGLDVSGLDVAH